MPARSSIALAMFAVATLAPPFTSTAGAACTVSRSERDHSLWNYDGDISQSLRIRMTLTFKLADEIEGVYFYATALQDIPLRGRLLDGSHIVLEELDSAGRATARFEGQFAERDPRGAFSDSALQCEVIVGSWIRTDSGERRPFYLSSESRTSGTLADRYEAAGVDDDERIHRSAKRFQDAVRQRGTRVVASLIRYPVTLRVAGKPPPRPGRSREELRRGIFRGVPRAHCEGAAAEHVRPIRGRDARQRGGLVRARRPRDPD